jgi:hypothetical protein
MEKPYWRKKLPISTTRLSFGDIVCAVANLAGDPRGEIFLKPGI